MTLCSAESVFETLTQIRTTVPLVQNITNTVASNISANVLLALGASPAMIEDSNEAEELVTKAAALVINIGTLKPPQVQTITRACRAARKCKTPWVLDPVAAGFLTWRSQVLAELLRFEPGIIRANAGEIAGLHNILAGHGPTQRTRGADSLMSSMDVRDTAMELAQYLNCVIFISGDIDLITDGQTCVGVHNGHAIMPRVTALGCSLSAVTAACRAVNPDPFAAAVHAAAIFGVAGELAARQARGPGSFAVALLDELYNLDADTLKDTLRAKALSRSSLNTKKFA